MKHEMDMLLSVPPAAAVDPSLTDALGPLVFAASDPPGRQLGSGGGTVHLLHKAWQQASTRDPEPFSAWLARNRKLMIHGSGQSRRLPAYAAEGKLMLPLPLLPTLTGQGLDQTLLDLQRSDYGRLFRHAPPSYRLMVACGDVLVRSDHWIPHYPEADVLIIGLKASAQEASNHGVMFSDVNGAARMAFFLQKPPVKRIHELSNTYSCSLDTGVWLFSARAVEVLMRKCGWDGEASAFAGGEAAPYELFDQFGLSLGHSPTHPDPEIAELTCAVLPLPDGRFYHFGTNRSVFASLAQLSHPAERRRSFGQGQEGGLTQIALHAAVEASLPGNSLPVWIENSEIPEGWTLSGYHVLTGIPHNNWSIRLPRGLCMDAIGLRGRTGLVFRIYGFDDCFKGRLDAPDALWCGKPATDWFATRGISWEDAGIDPSTDLQDARIFPLLQDTPETGPMLQWMVAEPGPGTQAALRRRWLESPRVSATELIREADVQARADRRRKRIQQGVATMRPADWKAVSCRLDLARCIQTVKGAEMHLPPLDREEPPGLPEVHLAMAEAYRNQEAGEVLRPFAWLHEILISDQSLQNARPVRNVLDDQIVWARSPARLDLAGGWSDTPPYCLEHGGRVVNVAVNLNGQPPVQVFARICDSPKLILHSIDLGLSETIDSYEELVKPSALGGFSIARAALRLAGFDPRFHLDGGASSLPDQLRREFGGGIELNMLAAIPKGSGLGTSSILSGTLLGALGEVCGLGWSTYDLYARTSAIEQLLTSGGGWQDQVGGLAPGLKRIETQPGLNQRPEIRWLPDTLFREASLSGRALLYYTGITRVARNILGEIVRGIFLNDRRRIEIIEEIAWNADFAADVIQRQDWEGLQEVIRRSWLLNQALDAGTNPPGVQEILDRIEPWKPSCKLLGAGGGGYLLILTEHQESAAGIREALRRNPPNPRARFVELGISDTGLQITRS